MKYFTLLLISIAALTARAQYIDLLQSDTSLHWFAAHDNTSLNGTTHSETSENFIGHDTMINGRQYAITYNGLQRRHFREDAQHRIYALDPNDTVETLLYAFDAQPGDTIAFHGFIGDTTLQSHEFFYAIDSVDSMMIGGTLRHAVHVSTDIPSGQTGQTFALTWIEGIGDQHYGLHSVFVSDIYNGYSFCGIHTDTGYVYFAALKCYELLSVKDLSEAQTIRLYPNPATAKLTVENNSTELLAGYRIVDITGQQVADGILDNRASGSIPVSSLAPGVYFVLLSDANGHVFKQRIIKQ